MRTYVPTWYEWYFCELSAFRCRKNVNTKHHSEGITDTEYKASAIKIFTLESLLENGK